MVMHVDLGTARPRGMRWAAEAAWRSEHPIHRMGAVIVAAGNLLSSGFNKNRSHPQSPHQFCIHAEVDALLRHGEVLGRKTTLYVVRITKGGRWATSKPCVPCMIFMREYGIEKVVYVDEFGKITEEDL